MVLRVKGKTLKNGLGVFKLKGGRRNHLKSFLDARPLVFKFYPKPGGVVKRLKE
jgi:hypothetical protein